MDENAQLAQREIVRRADWDRVRGLPFPIAAPIYPALGLQRQTVRDAVQPTAQGLLLANRAGLAR